MRTTTPPTNREFFLMTAVLIGISMVFPPIAFLTGLLAVAVIAGWLLYDHRGFLRTVWRIFLVLLLLWSLGAIAIPISTPGVAYGAGWTWAGSIGMFLSLCGLGHSFLKIL
jgi:hypothetical protein